MRQKADAQTTLMLSVLKARGCGLNGEKGRAEFREVVRAQHTLAPSSRSLRRLFFALRGADRVLDKGVRPPKGRALALIFHEVDAQELRNPWGIHDGRDVRPCLPPGA